MEDTATGFGSGKVILLGEHAVVHGVPAIAAGLPRGVVTVARAADEDLLVVAPWGRVVRPDAQSVDSLSQAFAEVLASYPARPRVRLDVHVGLPPSAGLGCSAAIGVSVLDAIDKALGIQRTRADLGARALAWERFFHGEPSGIDNATAALGGIVRFQRQGGASKLSPRTPLHLVIAHSGQRSDTREMVARVRRRLEQQPGETRRAFDDVRALVGEAEVAIRRGDAPVLGEQLDHNHAVLCALGLSTPQVEAVRSEAKSAGALGAKVTGSGGGGCIVALAEDAAHARFITGRLQNDAFVAEVPRAA